MKSNRGTKIAIIIIAIFMLINIESLLVTYVITRNNIKFGVEQFIDNVKSLYYTSKNKEELNIAYKNYIKKTYGVVSETFKIESKIKGDYIISVPFIDNKFVISFGVKNLKMFGDNFYEILSNDKKFQHLYSEWVKKQVGIEDGDVELKIGFSKDNINFNGIISLSEDCHEIFENINRYEVMDAYIKNVIETDESSLKEKAEYYYNKLFINNVNVNNKKYYIYLIEADCDFKIFMNNRSGNYYSCCFENKELSNFEKHN